MDATRWPRMGRTDFVVVAVCAVGVGIATLAYAALDAVMLRPLPYAAPDRIVRVVGVGDDTIANRPLSLPLVRAIAARVPELESHAVADEWAPTVTDAHGAEYLSGASVSAAYFEVFGTRPHLGRLFDRQDDLTGHAPVVVLSHGFWQRRYGGDPAVVGRELSLNGLSYTVVGVLPPSWEDPGLVDGATPPVVWRATPGYFAEASRDGFSFAAVARVRAGVALERVRQAVGAAMRAEAAAYPADLAGRGDATVVPLLDAITGSSAQGLRLGFFAALVVWLIALANATNLLLLRALEHRRRMALCRALGASDARLLGELLWRQAGLATLGGIAGVALAAAATAALRASAIPGFVPRLEAMAMDPGAIGVALALSLVLGLASGAVASLGALRSPIALIAGREARASLGSRSTARRRVVVAQLALATALVATTLVLFEGYRRLAATDLGVRPDETLAVTVRAGVQDWDQPGRLAGLWQGVLEGIAARGGAKSAGAISIAPLADDFSCDGVALPDAAIPLAAGECAEWRIVAGDYFRSVGQVLLQGRALSPSLDREGARDVVVVSESAARRYWPGADALGKRLRVHERDRVVVGVVGDVRHFGPARAVSSTVYVPLAQEPTEKMTIMLRGVPDAEAATALVRELAQQASLGASVIDARPLAALAHAHVARPRSAALVIAAFALAGATLALVGLFSVVDYLVVRRRAEFALRIAVGARSGDLRRLVTADALRLALTGGGIGALCALLAAPALARFAPELSVADPRVLALAIAIMALAAVLSSLAPARRAAGTEPSRALSAE